jgi:ABC-type uncharacterized transport system involved in gliding motility auxiliary subunit
MGLGVGGLIALAVLFLGVVMLSNIGLRGMRVDLTQNKLYTLSRGTQQVLAELKEPVNLYFYFSRQAAAKQAPLVMPYANRVQEVSEISRPFRRQNSCASSIRSRSRRRRIAPRVRPAVCRPAAAMHSILDWQAPFPPAAAPRIELQADREEFLEYDVAKLINEWAPKPIGLLSSLGCGAVQPDTGRWAAWPILTQLQELFSIRTLTADVDHIDKDVDVLMLVHPKSLTPKTLYAIDQFVMRGGRILLFVDPNSGADTSGQDPSNPLAGAMADHSSDLAPLLAAWGVDYDATRSSATWSGGSRSAPACSRRRSATSGFSASLAAT